ncbi:TPA: plantaricin C family lantibiotic, partial [Staphylococcus aureus]|nr:plantaricin C family lantibiotic [Staphylococcus aureus]HCY4729679.1 plantaricin C family lantibiotic [Staphylococcus aureus]
SKEELLNYSKADYLEKLDSKEIQEVEAYGGKCSWWNLSCHLGNNGKLCTVSHECAAGCNF